jgi:hypothetical protein
VSFKSPQASRVGLCTRTLSLAAISLPLLIYVITRALAISFTVDESISYTQHVLTSLPDIFRYNVPLASSNNHLLNTLLMKAAGRYLGPTEFALRLPNVIAYCGYLWASGLIVRRVRGDRLMLPAFLLLVVNPFLLDWFSLARGYGLGLALMLGSLYFVIRALERRPCQTKDLYPASILASLTVIANIPFLDYFLAFLVWVTCIVLLDQMTLRQGSRRRLPLLTIVPPFAPLILALVIALAIMAPPILKLHRMGEFYYGGTRGFWPDTLGSLSRATLYGAPTTNALVPVLPVVALVLFSAPVVAALIMLVREGSIALRRPGPTAVGITLLTATLPILEHYLIGTRFRLDRTAIDLIPLFCLSLVAWSRSDFASLKLGLVGDRVFATALTTISGLALVNLAVSVNWMHPYYIDYDASTKQMMADLSLDYRTRQGGHGAVTLAVPPYVDATVNFYRITWKMSWLKPVVSNSLTRECDCTYVYSWPPDRLALRADCARRLLTIRTYPSTGYTLSVLIADSRP